MNYDIVTLRHCHTRLGDDDVRGGCQDGDGGDDGEGGEGDEAEPVQHLQWRS